MSQRIRGIIEPDADLAAPSAFLNPWQIVLRHKWIVVLGVVVGLALGLSYFMLKGPEYESTAELLVIKKQLASSPISGASSGQPQAEDYLATHQAVIVSAWVVGEAVKKNNLQSLKCFRDKDDLTNSIIAALSVTRGSRKAGGGYANVLTFSFRGKEAEDCSTVVNAIIGQYQDFLKDTYRNVNSETLDLITRARDVLQKELEAKQRAYGAFRQNNPIRESSTIHQERLSAIDAKRSALRMRRAENQATLTAIESAMKNDRSPAELVEILSGSPIVREPGTAAPNDRGALDPEILKLQLQEASLSGELGRNHREMQALRKQIEVVRASMAPSPATGTKSPEQLAMDQDFVKRKIQVLKQDVDANKVTEKGLDREFEREQGEAKTALAQETEDEAFRKGIEQSRLLYESILKRLEDIHIVEDYGGYDTLIITPPERGKLVKTKILLIFAGALLLGSLAGLGGAYVVDISDKSFRTPEEIRRRLRLPVLGHIPRLKPGAVALHKAQLDATAPDARLCTYYRPTSPEAEAYRSVRTALFFSAHAQGYKVIQITSPGKGDGKTTLAANLAVSIAQAGKRILLVDADLRNSGLGMVYALSNKVGLTSVLTGEADLRKAIQPSAVPGLSILTCGPLPPNPAELLTSPRLQELFDSLRQQYDFVLVDTPPLLTVTDPCVVAARVDGVLLTIRLSLTSLPRAEQAREILSSLKANLLGVIVNGVGPPSGSYGHGYQR